jgi:hypothetical protein
MTGLSSAPAAVGGGVFVVVRIVLSGVSGEQAGVEFTVATDDNDDASLSFLPD